MWGGLFTRPHGITIGPDDSVYCVDDLDHTVRKFTPEGRLLMTLGTSSVASDTGSTSIDYRTIQRAGPPFHYPTNLAIAPSGDLYISDGYGNARITSPDGKLLSWASQGTEGQFQCRTASPSIDGIVYADRENSRASSQKREFSDMDGCTPQQVFITRAAISTAELGFIHVARRWPDSTGVA
jgi:hypothetical protein